MALIERYQKTTDIGYWEGQIPMSYLYTVGRAGEKFFQEFMNGRIFGAKCEACKTTYVPAKIFCEKCFARLEDKYLDVGTTGTVHTFTQRYETFDGLRKETRPDRVAGRGTGEKTSNPSPRCFPGVGTSRLSSNT